VFGTGIHSPEDRRFVGQADAILSDVLAREPGHATHVGDHRFDTRLPDLTSEGIAEYVRVLRRHAAFLAAVDERAMSRMIVADLCILRTAIDRRIFELGEIRPHLWNPLMWNPAEAVFSLVSREFAHPALRARSLVGRLEAIPEFLDNARHTLEVMSRPHVETAISQLAAVEPMLAQISGPLADEPGVAAARVDASVAIKLHVKWLRSQLPAATRPIPLGSRLYGGVIKNFLETSASANSILARAYEDLDRITEELNSVSARYLGRSMAEPDIAATAVASLGASGGVDDDNILEVAGTALEQAAEFISNRQLLTVPRVDARIEVMPPVRRGILVAYCDAPGPMEKTDLPTVIGLAPTDPSWDESRRASYYREYNTHTVYDLMVHEGLPGHLLQTTMARRAPSPTSVRACLPSGLFMQGWAVYAEELMARSGFVVDQDQRGSFRIAQLKMQARTILNTIVEVELHTNRLTESDATRLLASRGYQEPGELAGKWRRAQLTYGQLPTYHLGYRAVAEIVQDLGNERGTWSQKQVHDTVLSHGSVSPQWLRPLLGLE
jgi:uncharacterized protein (DUF885 family)